MAAVRAAAPRDRWITDRRSSSSSSEAVVAAGVGPRAWAARPEPAAGPVLRCARPLAGFPPALPRGPVHRSGSTAGPATP
jgi:hypothetical protein